MCANGFILNGKDERQIRQVCGVVQERVCSTPTVVGFNSHQWLRPLIAQLVEQWTCPGPPIPVTKGFQCGEGTRYFDETSAPVKTGKVAALETRLPSASAPCSMRQQKLKPTRREPLVPTGNEIPGWRRAELLRLSHDAGLSPRYSVRFSSRIDVVRRESQPVSSSRRGGRVLKSLDQPDIPLSRRIVCWAKRLDVVKVRVTSLEAREVVSSNLTWSVNSRTHFVLAAGQ